MEAMAGCGGRLRGGSPAGMGALGRMCSMVSVEVSACIMTSTPNQGTSSAASHRLPWRKWHRITALASAPFTLISAVCGGLLLFRKTGLYERRGPFRETIQRLHSFEIILPYVGVIAVALMILATVTGLVLYFRGRRAL